MWKRTHLFHWIVMLLLSYGQATSSSTRYYWPHSTLVLGFLFFHFKYLLPSLIAYSVVWILFVWQWNGSKDELIYELVSGTNVSLIAKFIFCLFVRMAVNIQLVGKSKKLRLFSPSIVWSYHQDTNWFTLWFWQAGSLFLYSTTNGSKSYPWIIHEFIELLSEKKKG